MEFILEDSVAPLSMERIVDIANSSLQTEAAIADAPDLEVSAVKEEAEESSSKELMLLVEEVFKTCQNIAVSILSGDKLSFVKAQAIV